MKLPRRIIICRWLALVSSVAGVALLAGCLIIPVNYYATGSRQNVGPKTSGLLSPGVTTKDEVFLALGEPDFISADGQRLGYGWTKVVAFLIIGDQGGEIMESRLLEVSFDASNRVSQLRILKKWDPTAAPARESENPR